MYLIGKGQSPTGPGTATVQRIDWTGAQERQMAGLGCACQQKQQGLGIFASLSPQDWGWQEWAAVIGGAYVFVSVFSTTSSVVGAARRYPGERRRKKAAYYRQKAAELSR